MAKGRTSETCSEAIRDAFNSAEILSFTDLYQKVTDCGNWKSETIWQHLMGLIVNLPPARYHWHSMKPFLFCVLMVAMRFTMEINIQRSWIKAKAPARLSTIPISSKFKVTFICRFLLRCKAA